MLPRISMVAGCTNQQQISIIHVQGMRGVGRKLRPARGSKYSTRAGE